MTARDMWNRGWTGWDAASRNLNEPSRKSFSHYVEGSRCRFVDRGQEIQP
jgi:hypothetical protein